MNYNTKYVVRLTVKERQQLEAVVRTGRAAAAKRLKAQVLLKADAGPEGSGWTDKQLAEALELSVDHVHGARQAYVEQGLEAALERKPRSGHSPRKLDGDQEARLIALACGPTPAGRALDVAAAGRQVGRIGDRRFHRQGCRAAHAQKNDLKPWLKQQ